MKVFFTIFLLLTSSILNAKDLPKSGFIQNVTYKGDMSTVGVPPGMPAYLVKFRYIKNATLTISNKDIDYKFSANDPNGLKGKGAKLIVTDSRGEKTYKGVWSLEPNKKEPNRYGFLNKILANNNFILSSDGTLKCNTCRNDGLPYIWRIANTTKSNKNNTSTSSATQSKFAGFSQGIFGIKYGTKPSGDMKFFDKNTSGKSVNWYTKKKPDLMADGIKLTEVYYGYSDKGFYSMLIKAKGRSVNQIGGKITSIYGLATKSKTKPFAVSHVWEAKKYQIIMNANYMHGGSGSFMVTHKE